MAHRPNTVRIIGGEHRGRLLRFATGPGLRPTPDRVRETVFNWLGQDLTGLRCLDLFAGSGALGFEALSRNAAEVVFVDSSREVITHLRAFAEAIGTSRATIRQGDALEFLRLAARSAAAPGGRFDVVFLDPPFGQEWIARVEPLLEPVLAPGGRVHVETGEPWTPAHGLRVMKSGRAGVVHHALAMKSDEERS
jgi:16S rRNA (guanine(966)-N(2))-methyltransferase RsmD